MKKLFLLAIMLGGFVYTQAQNFTPFKRVYSVVEKVDEHANFIELFEGARTIVTFNYGRSEHIKFETWFTGDPEPSIDIYYIEEAFVQCDGYKVTTIRNTKNGIIKGLSVNDEFKYCYLYGNDTGIVFSNIIHVKKDGQTDVY